MNTRRTQLLSSLALVHARFAAHLPITLGLIAALSSAATARAQTSSDRPNGLAAPGNCADGEEWDGRECFPKCSAGYTALGPLCIGTCEAGATDLGALCMLTPIAKQSYGRGAGNPLGCGPGEQQDGALCYPACRKGYSGVGPVCWQQCGDGYSDWGALCFGSLIDSYFKDSYGRGVGQELHDCPAGSQKDGGLCYPNCQAGYSGVGPVCWQSSCPAGYQDQGAVCGRIDAKPSYTRAGHQPKPMGECIPGVAECDTEGFSCQVTADASVFRCLPNYGDLDPQDAAACETLYDLNLANAARVSQTANTFSAGAAATAGPALSMDLGTVYGPDGQYGCFRTTCEGDVSDVSISTYAAFGVFESWDKVPGAARVFTAGATTPEVEIGFTTAEVVSEDYSSFDGTIQSISIGVGIIPVQAGALWCQTTVYPVSAGGAVKAPSAKATIGAAGAGAAK